MDKPFTKEALEKVFTLLSDILDLKKTEQVRLVVCGGSALIATGLRNRVTSDADVVALMDSANELLSPDPLPPFLLEASSQVSRDFGLSPDWLNNEPSKDGGGLFQLGLPDGFATRLTEHVFGPRLTLFYIGRLDQIFFKLYAAADESSPVHLEDLCALNPNDAELEAAARWSMTHDVSEGFRWVLKELLKGIGHESAAKNI